MFFSKNIIKKILKNKKKLESKLKIKMQVKANELILEGDEFNVYIAEKTIEALEKNFPINAALMLLEENYIMENLPIKSVTKRKNLAIIKARIIGTEGKTLKLISELSDCYLQLNDNVVSIIGPAEKIKAAENAIKSLILGSKQTNVFKYLEKSRKKLPIEDLGLKIK